MIERTTRISALLPSVTDGFLAASPLEFGSLVVVLRLLAQSLEKKDVKTKRMNVKRKKYALITYFQHEKGDCSGQDAAIYAEINISPGPSDLVFLQIAFFEDTLQQIQ